MTHSHLVVDGHRPVPASSGCNYRQVDGFPYFGVHAEPDGDCRLDYTAATHEESVGNRIAELWGYFYDEVPGQATFSVGLGVSESSPGLTAAYDGTSFTASFDGSELGSVSVDASFAYYFAIIINATDKEKGVFTMYELDDEVNYGASVTMEYSVSEFDTSGYTFFALEDPTDQGDVGIVDAFYLWGCPGKLQERLLSS